MSEKCQACDKTPNKDTLDWMAFGFDVGRICRGCFYKGIVWAAKQALAAERAANAYGGNLTLTVDPAAINAWPGNCAPPTIGLGHLTSVAEQLTDVRLTPLGAYEKQLDIARGLGDAGIPGVTPDLLPDKVAGVPIRWTDGEIVRRNDLDPFNVAKIEVQPNVLGSNVEESVAGINDESQPAADPFYVKQREDWRNRS